MFHYSGLNFAVNDKKNTKVRHILSHTAGLSGWDKPMTTADIYDHENATSNLAEQKPWWEPGTASEYRAITQGHLVDELVRRVAGKALKECVQ